VLIAFVTTLASCITLEDEVEEASPFSQLKVDSAIVDDNFTMMYRAPKGATEIAPVAVYTTNFWTPAFFEYAQPNIKSVPMTKFNDTIWIATVQVPRTAQVMSYTVLGVPDEDSLATKNFPILDSRTKRPIKATMYRIAQALMRSNAPTDSVLKMLRAEIDRYLIPTMPTLCIGRFPTSKKGAPNKPSPKLNRKWQTCANDGETTPTSCKPSR
jgi:hypothetical protein